MFGIVNIEALACGCPVIGWGNSDEPYSSEINFRGGKIIENGKQGFLVEYNNYSDGQREASIEKAVQSVKNIGQISRLDCRKLFEEKFTTKIMTNKIEKYYGIIKERKTVLNVTGEL
jgi:glycosyltransferase involved in cell wall biosynthesis